jgi:hypothetical protein
MSVESYREKFEVGKDEITKAWSTIQSVFELPPIEERQDRDAWPSFPSDPFFQESCDLAFLDGFPFESRVEFRKFKEALADEKEEKFVLLKRFCGIGDAPYLFSFPADIEWATFNDDRQQYILPGIDHYAVGSSARWGVFFLELYNLYILAYKDRTVLQAFQHAYEFEGRGTEIVEPFSMKLSETRRIREIAEEIRQQEN